MFAIRVIPEIDNPGHSNSVGSDPGLRDIVACYNFHLGFNIPDFYKVNGSKYAALDPTMEKTY